MRGASEQSTKPATTHTLWVPIRQKVGLSMNVSDLADKVAADNKLTKTQAKSVIDGVFAAIAAAAARGEEVSVPGFGKFKVQNKPARTGRNPSTGAKINIAASRKCSFQPAKALKDSLAR